jgi:hypothetical protein
MESTNSKIGRCCHREGEEEDPTEYYTHYTDYNLHGERIVSTVMKGVVNKTATSHLRYTMSRALASRKSQLARVSWSSPIATGIHSPPILFYRPRLVHLLGLPHMIHTCSRLNPESPTRKVSMDDDVVWCVCGVDWDCRIRLLPRRKASRRPLYFRFTAALLLRDASSGARLLTSARVAAAAAGRQAVVQRK